MKMMIRGSDELHQKRSKKTRALCGVLYFTRARFYAAQYQSPRRIVRLRIRIIHGDERESLHIIIR